MLFSLTVSYYLQASGDVSETDAGGNFIPVLATLSRGSDELFPHVIGIEFVRSVRAVFYPDYDYFTGVSPSLFLGSWDSLHSVTSRECLKSRVVKDGR